MPVIPNKLKERFIQDVINPSLEVAGETLVTLSERWIPIATGALRESTHTKKAKDGIVTIVSGDTAETSEYVKYQYNDSTPSSGMASPALNHVRKSGTYESLLDYDSDYGKAYKKAQAGNVPGWSPSRAMWFKRVMADKKSKNMVMSSLRKQIDKRIEKLLNG